MKLRIEMSLDNATVRDEIGDLYLPGVTCELARATARIVEGLNSDALDGCLRDVNGNRIGEWKLIEEEAEEEKEDKEQVKSFPAPKLSYIIQGRNGYYAIDVIDDQGRCVRTALAGITKKLAQNVRWELVKAYDAGKRERSNDEEKS